MRLIILGPTGTGKGTQAKFIARLLKIKHIESGAILRKEAKKNNFIKEIINKGKLVPDRLIIKIINKIIKNRKNFILDGFPRTLTQAKLLKFTPNLVIYLKTNKNNLVKRLLLRKRSDDTKENIKEKYNVYLKKTLPVINHYKRKKLLVTVNGNPSINQVSKNIKKILTKYLLQ